jgi:uncharacterized metal-binding protein/rhodanese-related sulfurtransferase
MVCRSKGIDCYDIHDESLLAYRGDTIIHELVRSASLLIDNGRAGTLDRVEEIINFATEHGYVRVGVAACFSMKELSTAFCAELERAGLVALPVLCASGAVKEREIDPGKTTEAVSCNPAGQAEAFNRLQPDLVVEMGLCLGHDIIFHRRLKVPHTVLVVKDRKRAHVPAAHFSVYRGDAERFLEGIDASLAMKPPEWLAGQLKEGIPIQIIDLRSKAAFDKAHISGSKQCLIQELPKHLDEIDRPSPIVCVCNGGIQSAYATMYLSMRGFSPVYNLSGGFSKWERDGFPVSASPVS